MSEVLTSIIAFVVALGLLVAVHEYGHFYVARRLGVKVLRFCIGFGKPIWSKVAGRDSVEYAVAAIPLGGYVKLLDEREGPVPEADLPRAFTRQTPSRRIAILAAGPAFNFIFAVAAYWLMFVTGVTAMKPLIGEVMPDSLASAAGLRAGDQIVSVAGRETRTMMDAQLAMVSELASSGRVPMRVAGEGGGQRQVELVIDGQRSEFTEDLGALWSRLGMQPWRPLLPPVLGDISPDGTAAASGLSPGDVILLADGEPVRDWTSWVDYVRQRPGQAVEVVVERDGARVPLSLAIGRVETDEGVIGRDPAAVRAFRGRRSGGRQNLGDVLCHGQPSLQDADRGRVAAEHQRSHQHRPGRRLHRQRRAGSFPEFSGRCEYQPGDPQSAAHPHAGRRSDRLSGGRGGQGEPGVREGSAHRTTGWDRAPAATDEFRFL
jgi:regulator of sigma E protease